MGDTTCWTNQKDFSNPLWEIMGEVTYFRDEERERNVRKRCKDS
jgi:hypothetical protein